MGQIKNIKLHIVTDIKKMMQRKEHSPPPAKRSKPNNKGHWTRGLQQTLADKSNIIKETEHVCVIKDKFPKAKYHYLIIHQTIPDISSLRKEHVSLINHMVEVAKEVVSKVGSKVVFK